MTEVETDESDFQCSREVLASGSASRGYQDLVVGARGIWPLLRFELLTGLLSACPGALGLVLRRRCYKWILGSCGRGVIIGRGVILRHPGRIHIGDGVVINDNCLLDARSTRGGIHLGDGVVLSHGVSLACKDGTIRIGARTGFGLLSAVHSVGTSAVEVGEDCAIAAYTYLIGGSHYHTDQLDLPISQQGLDLRGGVRVGDACWLGARTTIVDGVTVGDNAIIGAAAVVTHDVPAFAVAVGVPARVVDDRRASRAHHA